MFLLCSIIKDINHDIDYKVLYGNIDQILPNKLSGQLHYKICDTCIYDGHVFYILHCKNMTKTNPPISQFNSLCNEFTSVWSMVVYNIKHAISIPAAFVNHNHKQQTQFHFFSSFYVSLYEKYI